MVEVMTLKNQIRIVTDEMLDVETVSLGIWVCVGSRYEEKDISGISHLLEHMVFKGTASRTALQIAQSIENVGGVINAYTSKDVTAYYVKVLKEDVLLALDVLIDIFQNSVMNETELNREKGVVLQEISQTYDVPGDAVFECFYETAYPNQPMGRPILGKGQIVQSLTSDDLLSYMKNEYTTPRVILSAAGKIKHTFFVEQVEQRLTKLNPSGGRQRLPAIYKGGEFVQKKDIEQVNLILGFKGFSLTDEDYYAQTLLSTILGGGMSSRLFQEIREKRGLVYSIYSFASGYADTGLFGVFAQTGQKEVKELLPVVCEELLKICSILSDEELDRAKAQLKAMILMKREKTSARCESNARDMAIYGRVVSKDEILRRISDLDKTKVQSTAFKIFSTPLTLACLGPVENVLSYEKLQSYLKI